MYGLLRKPDRERKILHVRKTMKRVRKLGESPEAGAGGGFETWV